MKRPRARALRAFILLLAGFAAGYYVRDQRQDDELRQAVHRAREEMRDAGLEAIDRARRAGAGFASGAEAAAESTRAAFRELVGRDGR